MILSFQSKIDFFIMFLCQVYDPLLVLVSQEGEDPEQLDFANNFILGTGCSADGKPLFFTLVHGLISFSPNNIPEVDKSA